MNTETKAISPAELGFSIEVTSGPTGAVRDNDWPCIEYGVKIARKGREVWSGPYRLGVGHVDPKKYRDRFFQKFSLTADEEQLVWTWQQKPHAQFINKARHADAAAKLAGQQKVTPKLSDVMGSLLLDGSAFFDGETFEDWAANFGYDADSRKAEAMFRECDNTGRVLARSMSADELASLREWASNQ